MVKVSVIIPTYQSATFVRDAVESVLNQTYSDYEVIIVDGGSTDGTIEILESYGKRIKIIHQKGLGISNARNTGIQSSNGEYIAFLDSDDVWISTKLEFQVKLFDEESNTLGLIYSDALFFQERSIKFEDIGYKNRRAFEIKKPHRGRVLRELSVAGNFIPASTVIVRKQCFEKVGLFDESLTICEDIDMWMRIAEFFEIDFQNVVSAKIRLHADSACHDRERLYLGHAALHKKIMERTPHLLMAHSSRASRYRYSPNLRLGIYYLSRNDAIKARKEIKQYINGYPYHVVPYFLLLLTISPFALTSLHRFIMLLPGAFEEVARKSIVRLV